MAGDVWCFGMIIWKLFSRKEVVDADGLFYPLAYLTVAFHQLQNQLDVAILFGIQRNDAW